MEDFHPDMRSIFFNSLDSSSPYYQEAMTLFNNNSLFNSQGAFNKQTTEKYNQALIILQNGIATERSNEQAYFNSILSSNKLPPDTANKLKSKLDTIFTSSGPFQYNEFITLINNILLGEQQYKDILLLERKRLHDLDAQMKVLKRRADAGRFMNKTNSKGESLGINNAQDLEQFLYNEYLEKHNMGSFRGEFKGVNQTIDNIISHFIDDTIKNVLLSDVCLKKIQQLYVNQKDIYDNDFIPQLINNIMKQLQSGDRISKLIISTINNDKQAIQNLSSDIINSMSNDFERILINNQDSSFGRKNKKTSAIKEEKENEKAILSITGSGLAQDILNNEQKLNNFDIDYFDLKKERSPVQEALQNFKQQLEQAKQWLQEHNETENNLPDNIKTAISKAKTSLSNRARNTVQQKIQNLSKQAAQDTLRIIQDLLSSNIFHISGPTYSEIIDTVILQMKAEGESFWSGPKNLKADSIFITVDTPNINLNTLNSILTDNEVQNIYKDNAHMFYDSFQSHLPKAGERTNFAQGRLSWMKATYDTMQNLYKTIEDKNLEGQQKTEALKELANIMKNTIVVTETMKTFDTYYNELGFVSGSLGPEISSQLLNFQELFNQAGIGMTNTEMCWLEAAIVNCSPAALGAGNQSSIEKYLSTLAGFAVFDEGSAELSLIAKTASEFYLENSPKLLHIYKLNGLYYPGSYILSRIYDNLTKAISQTQSEVVNNDGAHIRANATESLIPKNEHNLSIRWRKTYESAKKVTSIDITFLSGLLNIADQLLLSAAHF